MTNSFDILKRKVSFDELHDLKSSHYERGAFNYKQYGWSKTHYDNEKAARWTERLIKQVEETISLGCEKFNPTKVLEENSKEWADSIAYLEKEHPLEISKIISKHNAWVETQKKQIEDYRNEIAALRGEVKNESKI